MPAAIRRGALSALLEAGKSANQDLSGRILEALSNSRDPRQIPLLLGFLERKPYGNLTHARKKLGVVVLAVFEVIGRECQIGRASCRERVCNDV